jgi:hypothetical protein
LSSLASGLLGAAVFLARVGLDGSLWLGLGRLGLLLGRLGGRLVVVAILVSRL